MKKALIVIGMLTMSGCALLNPYESSFSCPETSNGKCVSVQTAYSESAKGTGKSPQRLRTIERKIAVQRTPLPVPVDKWDYYVHLS